MDVIGLQALEEAAHGDRLRGCMKRIRWPFFYCI
jgi:hypothetical protein